MTNKGWDFNNPIKEDYDKDKSKSETRAERKQKEIDTLIEAIKNKKGRFKIKDINNISDDIKVCERFNRHLNSLVKIGSVKKSGRGQSANYKMIKK